MDDKSLRQHIIAELDIEPGIDASAVGVTVSDGIVTLDGHVSSYAEKAKIGEIVAHIHGVKGIAEEFRVHHPRSYRTSDDEIAARAVSHLKWNVAVPQEGIHVNVHDGWVTLKGEVERQYQKTAAHESLRNLDFVRGVTNEIEVRPRAGVIAKRVEDTLSGAN